MNNATLALSGLSRNRVRSTLTILSVIVAFLLFGLLRPVVTLFEEGPQVADTNRLIVSPRHSISDMLTLSHASRIEAVVGVDIVAHQTWFGATYIDPANNFPQWAVSADEFLKISPEIVLGAEARSAFRFSRTGIIAGRELAERFGWKVGDKIPLIPNIWRNRDDSHWEFDLVGIFDGRDESVDTRRLFINYEYFDEYRAFAHGTISNVLLTVEEGQSLVHVARAVDSLFANSQDETTTQTENEYILSFAGQLGDVALIVNAILLAVFFTIVLLTANTMSQAARERIPDFAVLKTLGFKNPHLFALVVGESILIVSFGALIGLGIAVWLIGNLDVLVPALDQFGVMTVSQFDAMAGLILAIAIGLLVGIPPAIKVARIEIVDALQSI